MGFFKIVSKFLWSVSTITSRVHKRSQPKTMAGKRLIFYLRVISLAQSWPQGSRSGLGCSKSG